MSAKPTPSSASHPDRASSRGSRPKLEIPDHEVLRCIGEGAYGEVWLARNVLGAYRAVKVVYRSSFRDERAYEREFRGIQSYEPISRSNDGLLDLFQAGRNDALGHYYYIMELADAANADAATAGNYHPKTLATEAQQCGRLAPADCVQLGLQLTLALGHLHRHGLIHRDIKPSNIIFVQGIPKLADIGLVTTFDETCSFVGTEGFVPPEGPTSPRADIYSLGKVLYEISTGKDRKDFPEPATGLGENSDTQQLAELNMVILKACAVDPQDRYQTAEEFHADLALLNSGRSVKWKRVIEKRLAFARRAGAVVGLIAVLAIGGYLFQRHQTREAKRLQQYAEELLAQRDIRNAENLFDRGDSPSALAHLANVLRRHPDNPVAAERIMAALTQRNFPRLVVQPLLHKTRLELLAHRHCAHLSPDGERIVTASEDYTVRLWNAHTGEETIPPYRHRGTVNAVEFSPGGQKLVTASSDGTACILDANTGALVFPPFQHEGRVNDAKFDPTGRFVATGGEFEVRIYSAETGELLYAPVPHKGPVNSVAFSPNGQWLATVSEDERVRIWEVGSGKLNHHFKLDGPVRLVRFSGDGKWLAAANLSSLAKDANKDWQLQIWDFQSKQPLTAPLVHNHIYSLAFSPDNQRIVTADADNVALVWNVATGERLLQLRHSAAVYSAVFSRDGRQILTASVDHTARLWNAATGAPVSESMLHEGRVIHAEFSPQGQRILTAGWEDRTVKLWEIRFDRARNRTLSHDGWVMAAEFDATGREAVTATSAAILTANNLNASNGEGQHAVVVWDATSGASKHAPTLAPGAEAVTARFTGTGPKALIADRKDNNEFARRARICDLAKATPVIREIQHDQEITCAHFSADGLKLASASEDGIIMIWDARTGGALKRLVHQGRPLSIRFSPDGTKLVAASADGTAMVWDVNSGQRLAGPLKHDADVWLAQFSPRSDKVVTVSLDYTAKIWSTNGALIATLRHSAPVEYAEFSPDGTKVVTASGDRTARLWSVATGKQLAEPLQHEEVVLTARFSPDGRRVITASMDRTAQLWDVATGLKLADPFRHSAWVISASFSVDGRRAITASLDGTVKIWEVPMANSPIPPWLSELAEAVAGQRLNSDRIPEPVSWTEYAALKARLTKSSGPDLYLQWAQKFFAEPITPTLGADPATGRGRPLITADRPWTNILSDRLGFMRESDGSLAVVEDFSGGVVAAGAHHAPAGMRGGAAKIKSFDRRSIVRVGRQRPHETETGE